MAWVGTRLVALAIVAGLGVAFRGQVTSIPALLVPGHAGSIADLARAGTASLEVRMGDALRPELDGASSSTGHLVAEIAFIADAQPGSNAEAIAQVAQVCDAEQLGGDAVDAVDTPFSATANSGAHTRRTDGTPLVRPVGLMSSSDDAACSLLGSSGTPGAGAGASPGPGPGSPRLDPLPEVHEVPAPHRPGQPLPAFAFGSLPPSRTLCLPSLLRCGPGRSCRPVRCPDAIAAVSHRCRLSSRVFAQLSPPLPPFPALRRLGA